MNRFLLTLAAIIATSSLAQGQRAWLKDYGIDPANPCPVFTEPPRTGPARKEGAGICTNDGAAYNCTYYHLGEEWHYAPKLPLCEQEREALPQVTGKLIPREVLKFGVNPLPGGGALVTYRIFGYDSECAEHFLATYDREGHLLDALALGNRESLNEVLQAEPHGGYTPCVNMGGNHWTVDKEMTITLCRSYYYDLPDRKSGQWCDTLTYRVTAQGRFVLVHHKQSGKPAVNAEAEQLMELAMLPRSTANVVAQWNDLVARCQSNAALSERLLPHVASLMVSRPQEFITWTSQNTKRSVLIAALRHAIEADDTQAHDLRQHIAQAVAACPNSQARQYWQRLREF